MASHDPSRPTAVATRVVAVDKNDYQHLPHDERHAGSFSSYWRDIHQTATAALARGEQYLLRPLLAAEFDQFCRGAGLRPRSRAALDAYSAVPADREELVAFSGEPVEMLRQIMVYERETWAMMTLCGRIFDLAAEQGRDHVVGEARHDARNLLDRLLRRSRWHDDVVLVAKAGGGLSLGSYAITVGTPAGDTAIGSRDRNRFTSLLAASLLAGAAGVLTLRTPDPGGDHVLVWRMADQRLLPTEHGELMLEPAGGHDQTVTYAPGFDLMR
ncbi:hypothetical protein ACIQU4_27710 [Streptomyces sp. NPDC090741]|uniref:hypothetical protein n=1 Tax=Streptomyces sp. NPDC090741 TaxID=3365967 RepID=UPI0038145B49